MKDMEFIKSLEERDENYYRVASIRCEDWTQEVLRRVDESDRRCYRLCKESLEAGIKRMEELQSKELAELTEKTKEFEKIDEAIMRDNPDVDPLNVEMCTELVIELRREQIAKLEDEYRVRVKRLADYERNVRKALNENLKIFAATLREDNEKIIGEIRSGDEKFRNILASRITCVTQPLSCALRDALVRDRDTARELRLMKRITDWSLCDTNDRDNAEVIETFRCSS